MYTFNIKTKDRFELVNIDNFVREAIESSGVHNGAIIVFCPHTTGGITINENGDPDVKIDMISAFNRISPELNEYRHFEGNSHAHVLSSLVGASEHIIVNNGKAVLGTWQSVYFCEFDGPRNRKIHIKVLA